MEHFISHQKDGWKAGAGTLPPMPIREDQVIKMFGTSAYYEALRHNGQIVKIVIETINTDVDLILNHH